MKKDWIGVEDAFLAGIYLDLHAIRAHNHHPPGEARGDCVNRIYDMYALDGIRAPTERAWTATQGLKLAPDEVFCRTSTELQV